MAAATKEATEDQKLQDEIVRLRDEDELNWADIATQAGIRANKAMFLYQKAKVRPKDKIKFTDDDDLAAKIVELRDGDPDNEVPGLSWGVLSARSGVGEGKLRSLYEAATGNSTKGNRIGKGGRWPEGHEPGEKPGKVSATAKKAAAGSRPAKAAAPKAKASAVNPGKKHLADMNLDEITTRLTGKTITVRRDGKNVNIRVSSVSGLEDGVLSFNDAKSAARSVKVDDIVKASR